MELEPIFYGSKENMHVIPAPTSPSFLKPKPIKFRKKHKRPAAPLPLKDLDVNLSNKESLGYLIKSPRILVNPFRRSEKRQREPESIDEDTNSLLMKRTNNRAENSDIVTFPSPIDPALWDENALSAFSLPPSQETKSEKCEEEKVKSENIPVDWCLKTKIRFTSAIPFPRCGSFTTFEEVNGTVAFSRGLHSSEADNKSSHVHSSHGAKIFQHCLVFMHPCLPWLNLFPRTNDKKLKQTSSMRFDSTALVELHSAWCASFRSLYQLVKLYQCPYFYICAPTFTVLFRCAGAASIPVMHALISPTTKGLRKALTEEGIEFTMPLCQNKDTDSVDEIDENSQDHSLNEDDDREAYKDADDVEDEEPESWLESLGLSQDNFPSLNSRKRRDKESQRIDHAPQSLVYVEVTQTFINFLLNSDICTSKVGPMAGIPPTLLAPTPFLGGTLQSLKICQGTVRKQNKDFQSVEISGPLLPNAIHSLCSLFNTTQKGNFTSVITSHSPTLAFSMFTPQSQPESCIFAKNNMTDCGLPDEFVQQMCSKSSEEVLSSIHAENGLFTWN